MCGPSGAAAHVAKGEAPRGEAALGRVEVVVACDVVDGPLPQRGTFGLRDVAKCNLVILGRGREGRPSAHGVPRVHAECATRRRKFGELTKRRPKCHGRGLDEEAVADLILSYSSHKFAPTGRLGPNVRVGQQREGEEDALVARPPWRQCIPSMCKALP